MTEVSHSICIETEGPAEALLEAANWIQDAKPVLDVERIEIEKFFVNARGLWRVTLKAVTA